MSKGLLMVYTGDGKGKTTAALGLALRAIGWGKRALFLQFMKGTGNVYGERIAAQKYLPDLEMVQVGRDEFVNLKNPDPVDVALAEEGLKKFEEALFSGRYGLIVCDEINVAMACGLLKTSKVLELVEKRPDGVDLVFTGRYCPDEVVDAADMVSEVKEVKHHYRKGVPAREGIEY